MEKDRVWDNVLERYESGYPYYASRTRYWYPSGHYEITVILNDGSKYVYDELNDTVTPLRSNRDDDAYENEDNLRKEFARRLKRRMYVSCFNQEQLAEASGISRVTINKYLTGKSTPSILHLRKLSRALNCSKTELIEF